MERPGKNLASAWSTAAEVLEKVSEGGDKAVFELASAFDGVTQKKLQVPQEMLVSAGASVSPELKAAIDVAAKNIETFHRAQIAGTGAIDTMPGVTCWTEQRPIESVGLYVPGGNAPLFSTVLMLAIPATIAGCKNIVLCSPPAKDGGIHPSILYAAHRFGVHRVFAIGGAQAIAAMAHGTETVPKVDKIFGPGNAYVTAAKQLAQKAGVAIDMPAGPSEVLVCADGEASADVIAADLLSQAEHGPDSHVVLVVKTEKQAAEVIAAVDATLKKLAASTPGPTAGSGNKAGKKPFVEQSVGHSVAVVLEDDGDQLDFINAYAPEHLILARSDARGFAAGIENAGSVFLGYFSPESVGDYASGTNHTLPTFGYARSYSGVNLASFQKSISFQELSEDGLRNIGPTVTVMAEAENLYAHALAVQVRLDKENG